MRRTLHISLPITSIQTIEKIVYEEKFASKSEFIRFLVRLWDTKKWDDGIAEERESFERGFNLSPETIRAIKEKAEIEI